MKLTQMTQQEKPLILIGAGGHAKVLLSLVKALGLTVIGVCAPELVEQQVQAWQGIPVLRKGDDLSDHSPADVDLVNGVGQRVDATNRARVFKQFKTQGYFFPPLVHPAAQVDDSCQLDEGVQVMAGAVIQADVCIGQNVIVNTRACVDHDCVIGEQVHIAPGAILCGDVCVGRGSFIASGAVLIQGISVGEYATIGAGVSVARSVEAGVLILPGPVRRLKNHKQTELRDL